MKYLLTMSILESSTEHRVGSSCREISRLVCYLTFVFLAGCQTIANKSDADFKQIAVQKNLAGEECRMQEANDPNISSYILSQFNIFCGRWENPSGTVYEISTAEKDPEYWVDGGWWKQKLDSRTVCESQKNISILGGKEADLLNCQLKNGGWPYIALVTTIGSETYFADGIPVSLPVLEHAIGIASGQLSPDSEISINNDARFTEDLGLGEERLFGAGDIRTYYRLMKAGQHYNSIKDFATAANRYRDALALHTRVLGADNSGVVDPMMHLALELSNQSRFIEAEAMFNRVDTQIKNVLDQSDVARYLSYSAIHLANQNKFTAALERARQATAIRKELASENSVIPSGGFSESGGVTVAERSDVAILAEVSSPTTVDVVQSLYLEAAMLERLGDNIQAQATLFEAQGILQGSEIAPLSWEPELVGLSADIAKSSDQSAAQRKQLNTAVSLWDDVAPGERPGAITYMRLGEAYKTQGNNEDAIVAFRQGLTLIKSRNGNLSFEQLAPFFKTAFAIAQKNPEKRDQLFAEMFEAGQLIRSGQTAEDISRSASRLAATEGSAGETVRNLQDAQDQRYFLYRDYEAEVAKPLGKDKPQDKNKRLEAIRLQIAEVEQQIKEYSSQVQVAFPGYNQLVDAVVNVDQVIKLVKPDEAIVQVLLGKDDGLLFLVHDGRVNAVPLEISSLEVAEIVNTLRTGLAPTAKGKIPKYDVALAHDLYKKLLGDVSGEIKEIKRLITIPAGQLLSLPFGLLVTKTPPAITGYDYTDVPWLIKNNAISLLPSVRSFVDLRKVASVSNASKDFIGFGDFIPYDSDSVVAINANIPDECLDSPERLIKHRKLMQSLAGLPSTKFEIGTIAKTFSDGKAEQVFGSNFTESTVRSMSLSDYRILYFATHGVLPWELECQPEPALVASLSSPIKEGDNGLLDTSEIIRLKLDADLVVLSACNTGGPGLETGGESLSGLARAFFFAGARSLLVSHWLADDTVTVALMVNLFSKMKEDGLMAPAEALHYAKLKIINDAMQPKQRFRSHPIFWGSFSIVGDGLKRISGDKYTVN